MRESKVNISNIFRAHKRSLVDRNTNRPGGDDLFFFLLLPLFVSGVLVFCFGFDFQESAELKKTLVSSLAIFVGLLFNALVILINIAKGSDFNESQYKVVQELIANISFCILIAFFSVVLVLSRYWEVPRLIHTVKLPSLGQFIDFVALFLLTNFFFTFLMVIKRAYLIINSTYNSDN